MQPIAADVAHCMLGKRVSCAKTAEPIEMPFWGLTHMGQRNQIPPRVGALLRGDVTWQAHCNLLHDVSMSALCPPRATVPAEHTQRTSAFAVVRGDMTRRRCGLLPNYFEHLFQYQVAAVSDLLLPNIYN